MFNIEKYLEKITGKLDSSEAQKNKIVEIIKTETGIHIPSEQIKIEDSVIELSVNQSIKNKIFTYKDRIISKINSFGFKISNIK